MLEILHVHTVLLGCLFLRGNRESSMELTFFNGDERLDLNISFRKKIVPLTPY